MEDLILNLLEELCGDRIIRENRDIDLLEEGLMDSLDYVTLLIDLQDHLGLVIAPTELTREEMATPNRIIEVVCSRIEQEPKQ